MKTDVTNPKSANSVDVNLLEPFKIKRNRVSDLDPRKYKTSFSNTSVGKSKNQTS